MSLNQAKKDITFKVEKFEAYLKKREYAERTVFSYKTYIRDLLRYLKKNNTNFLEAEQHQISQYNIEFTRAQQLMLRKAIKAYADYLHRFKGKEKKEFILDIKKGKKKERRSITEKHLKKLRGALKAIKEPKKYMRYKVILELLLSTAVRVSEVNNLKWGDIDFKNNTILVKNGKGGKERKACLTRRCIDVLQEYRNHPSTKRTEAENYIIEKFYFRDGTTDRLTTEKIQEVTRALSEIAGVEPHLTVHDIRRGVATTMAENGANLYHIQQFLGHENPETTATYLRLDYEKANESILKNHPFQ